MQLTKRTPLFVLLLTLCLSCSEIHAKPSLGFWVDVWNNAGEAGKTIVDGLANATKDGVDAAKDAVDGLIDTKHKFLDDVKEVSDNLTHAIVGSVKSSFGNLTSNLASSIKNLESVAAKERNFIKRIALKNGINALKGLASQTAELGAQLIDLKAKIGGSVVEEVNDALKDLKQWGENQLARVANVTQGEALDFAKELINDLIDSFNKDVDGLRQLEKVKVEFLEQLIDNIQEYQTGAADLINSLNLCKGRESLICKFNIDHCIAKLPSAAGLKALIQKGEELAKTAIDINARVAQLLIQLEKDKIALAAKIAKIIADILAGRSASSSSIAPDNSGSSSSAPDNSGSSSSAPDNSGSSSSAPDNSGSSSSAPSAEESSSSPSVQASSTQRSGCATEASEESTSEASEESTSEASEESTTEEESTPEEETSSPANDDDETSTPASDEEPSSPASDEESSSPASDEQPSSPASDEQPSSASNQDIPSSTEPPRSGC